MKINLWAYCFNDTGYAVHSRGIAEALIEEGVDLAVEPGVMPAEPTKYYSDALVAAHGKNYEAEKTVSIVFPSMIYLKAGQRLPGFYPYCVFEGDRIPSSWAKALNEDFVTKVIVPSNHVKQACLASGVKKEIVVVPHGVKTAVFNPQADVKLVEKYGVFKDDRFTFLFSGGWKDGEQDRKGLEIALRAFCAEFKKDENVRFIAKVNPAYQPNPLLLRAQIEALKLPDESQRPSIQLLHAPLSENELAGLYRVADCFVAPSKADAFNMPVAEAMACGVPPITSSFGGQSDFMKDGDTGLAVPCELVPATGGYLYEGINWGKPNQKVLQECMRTLFNDQKEAKAIGLRASKHILENYTWRASAKKLLEVVK